MAKPKEYKGDDAVRVTCVKEYTVKAGSGAGAGEDKTFEAGKTYSVAPRSAAHLLRKLYAVREQVGEGRNARMVYKGDAHHFIDADAAKRAEAAKKAAEEEAEAKAKAAEEEAAKKAKEEKK